jgi:hypothetical protein
VFRSRPKEPQTVNSRATVQIDQPPEVVLDFPHRAVSVDRTTPGEITVAYSCARRADGWTDYTQEVWMTPEPGHAAVLQRAFEGETIRSVTRIKEVLENGEWRPAGA